MTGTKQAVVTQDTGPTSGQWQVLGIFVYTDLNTHTKHMQAGFVNTLTHAQLYCNPEKCTWFATSLSYPAALRSVL